MRCVRLLFSSASCYDAPYDHVCSYISSVVLLFNMHAMMRLILLRFNFFCDTLFCVLCLLLLRLIIRLPLLLSTLIMCNRVRLPFLIHRNMLIHNKMCRLLGILLRM